MNLQRRELKFQVPPHLVEPICDYIEPYCEMDYHSTISPSGYYKINSLYIDTDSMYLLECKRRGYANRFSVRLRSYGENPDFPVYMEIKNKNQQFIHKFRAPITSQETLHFLNEGSLDLIQSSRDWDHPYFKKIYFEILRRDLRPRLMTQYSRLAYFGLNEPYSRVTFDRALRCFPEENYNVFPNQSKFLSYDHEQIYEGSTSKIVMELKCELKIPHWMVRLVHDFELRHSQFSKYDSSWSFLTGA